MKFYVTHEVPNVEESLPVASCGGCGRTVFRSSIGQQLTSFAQENVTQHENVACSASEHFWNKIYIL